MRPLVSVIIPVYKVEAYLDECLQSVTHQTYDHLEIILVDDGSPDRCPEMCDAWAQKDSRIKVIHKTNGGVSDSRNAGLKNFSGDFVMFVDSDDVVAENLVETLLSGCLENNVQMSMCSLQNFKGKAPALQMKACSQELFSGKYICAHFFECFAAVPFAKLFHRSLVSQRSFILNRRVGEDVAFNYPVVYSQSQIAYHRVPMYFYRCNENSATGSYRLSWLDELDTFQEMLGFFLQKKEMRIYDYISAEYYARLLANEKKIVEFFPDERKSLERVRNLKKNFATSNCSSLGLKICIKIGVLFPSLFRKVFFKRQSLYKKKFKES